MTSVKLAHYQPTEENMKVYDQLYALYRELHDSFGGAHPVGRSHASDEEVDRDQIHAARVGCDILRVTKLARWTFHSGAEDAHD